MLEVLAVKATGKNDRDGVIEQRRAMNRNLEWGSYPHLKVLL
jgi:hypothetical protein